MKQFPIPLSFLLLAFFLIENLKAQQVSTLVDDPAFFMNHDCLVGPDGSIYSTDVVGNGSFNGQTVFKTEPNGQTSVFANGLNGATGLAMDNNANLYVAELNSGTVRRITSDGSSSLYASGLIGPAGMAFDSQGNLFVVNFLGNSITKITPNQQSSTFSTTSAQPVGIIIDDQDNLYLSHESPHLIVKYDPNGMKDTLVNIPNTQFQYMTFKGLDILVTGMTDHNIYLIQPDGQYTVYSGQGIFGHQDGPLDSASFEVPTGIATSPGGDSIYVVEKGRIRQITLSPSVGISEMAVIPGPTIYPQPCLHHLNIQFNTERSGEFLVFDSQGKPIAEVRFSNESHKSLTTSHLASGVYYYQWLEDGIPRLGGKFSHLNR